MWNPILIDRFKAERTQPFVDLLSMVDTTVGIKRIVDLGCGTGEHTAKLHQKCQAYDTLGIDNSGEMLAKTESIHLSGLRFKKQLIESFSPTENFDLVFSNSSLHWLPDHQTLFLKVFSWVSSRGQVAIQIPCNYDHPSHVIAMQLAKRYLPLGQDVRLNPILPVERYAQMLYHTGFKNQRCRLEVYLHPMKRGADVVDWTRGTLLPIYQDKMDEDTFDAFVDEYRTRIIETLGEGPYVYPFKRILMWGKRGE